MKIAVLTLALLTAGVSWADCDRPASPSIPDGSKAEREAMLEAHGNVQAYIEAGNSYLDCLKQEEATEVASETATAESSKARMDDYNAMVDDMQKVGDGFNAALKQFNARQQ